MILIVVIWMDWKFSPFLLKVDGKRGEKLGGGARLPGR